MENKGILATIMWNSNRWEDFPTPQDYSNAGHEYVQEKNHTYDCLNFAQSRIPVESDGLYLGYTPSFNRFPRFRNNLEIVLFKAHNYEKSQSFLTGIYLYPEIVDLRTTSRPQKYSRCNYGNIKALPENIIRLDQYIPISEEILITKGCLPGGKRLSKMRFNYLHSSNVRNLLKMILEKNDISKIHDFLISIEDE